VEVSDDEDGAAAMSQTFGNKRGFMHITLHEVLIFARGLIRLWPKFVRDFGLRQGL